jgi:hypothetical protein
MHAESERFTARLQVLDAPEAADLLRRQARQLADLAARTSGPGTPGGSAEAGA